MIKDGVLVDTSVFIEFFKGDSNVSKTVSYLLEQNRVVTTGIVIAELLQGMKNFREELSFDELFAELHSIEVSTNIWIKAGRTALYLRKKGITLPLTDVAIAVLSIENNLQVFTRDKHFKQVPGVRVYKS